MENGVEIESDRLVCISAAVAFKESQLILEQLNPSSTCTMMHIRCIGHTMERNDSVNSMEYLALWPFEREKHSRELVIMGRTRRWRSA